MADELTTGAGGEQTPSPGASPGSVTPPAGAPNWFDALDPELKGHIQNKGWDKLDPAAAAVEATKAHREAQKFLGTPAEQLLRLPRHDSLDEQKAFWQRLGAPADASGYKLSNVKSTEGNEIDDKFAALLATSAMELHLPADVLPRLAVKILDFFDGDEKEAQAANTSRLAVEKDTLSRNWGANYDTNFEIAKRGAKAVGLTEEFLNEIEKSQGYATVMENLRKLGVANGDARHLTATLGGDGTDNPALASREQAYARIQELKADKAFGARWVAGDAQAVRELEDLHIRAYGRQR